MKDPQLGFENGPIFHPNILKDFSKRKGFLLSKQTVGKPD